MAIEAARILSRHAQATGSRAPASYAIAINKAAKGRIISNERVLDLDKKCIELIDRGINRKKIRDILVNELRGLPEASASMMPDQLPLIT